MPRKRENHTAVFKSHVALAALVKGAELEWLLP
jgi:hypothetical protein